MAVSRIRPTSRGEDKDGLVEWGYEWCCRHGYEARGEPRRFGPSDYGLIARMAATSGQIVHWQLREEGIFSIAEMKRWREFLQAEAEARRKQEPAPVDAVSAVEPVSPPEEEALSEVLHVRVTPAELEAVKARARKAGKPFSWAVRRALRSDGDISEFGE